VKCLRRVGCVPPMGVGTFGIGGDFWHRDDSRDYHWIQALRRAFELGLTLVDTSELYGRGHAEELVKYASSDIRDLYIVAKIQPTATTPEEVFKRLAASAERLGRRVWLAMFHWVPVGASICDVVKALEAAVEKGLAYHYGLSNVTAQQLRQALTCYKKTPPAAVENRYSLLHRRDEVDIFPIVEREGMLYIAYSPLERGALALDPFLAEIGKRYGKTAAQVALNWYTRWPHVVPVPKAADIKHVEENAGALGWTLTEKDWELINTHYYAYRFEASPQRDKT